jgi:hypothetical protein
MIFDLVFIGIFLALEVVYYISFRKHEKQVHDDLVAISERLEILLEKYEKPQQPEHYESALPF